MDHVSVYVVHVRLVVENPVRSSIDLVSVKDLYCRMQACK